MRMVPRRGRPWSWTLLPFLVSSFSPISQQSLRPTFPSSLQSTSTLAATKSPSDDPQVLASGFSQSMDLKEAVAEATAMALGALPSDGKKIDLAIVSVSSLYDGSAPPSDVVPSVLDAASTYGQGIQHLVGSTNGGFVSSRCNLDRAPVDAYQRKKDSESDEDKVVRACIPTEREGVPGVSVTLAILPDVNLKTFHVIGDDVPDDYGRMTLDSWKRSVGLSGFDAGRHDEEDGDTESAVFVLPSPAFQNDLDDLLRGFGYHYPSSSVFGGIASTVSSLSRARLFRYDATEGDECIQTLADGCVGVAMSGDIEVKTMIAQGAKPVGGVYQIVKGEESTISAIALDEAATELVRQAEELEQEDAADEEDEDALIEEGGVKASMVKAYAKARIPKPVLAEANFLMKTLSDDDQAFMRKALLVGLERGGSIGRSPSELVRLAEGRGPNFMVHQVASAAMKDGSITLSLGSVNIQPGTRLRFYVRESDFAKKEVEALWMGYKRKMLAETLEGSESFTPTGCFMFPTLDRGSKFFLGKSGFESETASEYLPTVPCISGFFSNGAIGALQSDRELSTQESSSLYGSATGYILIGSKSRRPLFSPTKVAQDEANSLEQEESEEEKTRTAEEDAQSKQHVLSLELENKAPRDEKGELILKRREVHSGRALTVSTVEWSVADKTATPTSTLEGFMWEKETEVDRFRERVPLANLVSQCRLNTVDPSEPKPRDWVGRVNEAAKDGKFVIIPECKRSEPTTGSLRKRYDITKLVKKFTLMGVPAISVNCDGVLFGGTLEDLTKAREATSKAAMELSSEDGVVIPPILASDLLLYPYQLYKMRLAGADAVNLVVGALEPKDLLYMTKIAASLQMQIILTTTSAVQISNVDLLSAGSIGGLVVSNRKLEDFTFDMSGEQALDILKSDAMQAFREKHGDEVPVLVEGRVGIIAADGDDNGAKYLKQLQEAGATGAIVGGGLVGDENNKKPLGNLLDLS